MKIPSIFIFLIAASLIGQPLHAGSGLKNVAIGATGVLVVNAATNGALYQKAKSACSTNPAMCAIAVMAGTMMIVSLAQARKSRGIEGDLSCANTNSCFNDGVGSSGNPYNLDGSSPIDQTIVNLERESANVNRGLSDLKNEGYVLNPDGSVTNPDGSTTAANALNNSSGLNGSPAQLAEAKRIASEVANEGESLLKRIEEYDEEMGGGRGAGSVASFNSNTSGVKSNYARNNASTTSVAGLSVNHGSDKIGVTKDNIFDMIHRRYEVTAPTMNANGQ